jgi:hypothetical protein
MTTSAQSLNLLPELFIPTFISFLSAQTPQHGRFQYWDERKDAGSQSTTKRTSIEMNYRTLGKTGLQVSEVGYGAWGIGKSNWIGASDDESIPE